MDKTIKTLIFIGILCGLRGYVIAQESVNAAGGDALGFGGSASYSVGQVYFTTIGENGTTVAQGVQQAAIPTVSEWGLLILMLLVIIIGVQCLKAIDESKLNSQITPNFGFTQISSNKKAK